MECHAGQSHTCCTNCESWFPSPREGGARLGRAQKFCSRRYSMTVPHEDDLLSLLFNLHVKKSFDSINVIVQVAPVRVHSFNHTELPWAMPFLHELLAFNGFRHREVMFIPDEGLDPPGFRESIKRFILVDAHPIVQCACHADIERSAVAICQDLNGWMFLPRHGEVLLQLRLYRSGCSLCGQA